MVVKVQRWSPATCDCVIEQQVEYHDTLVDENGNPVAINQPRFLMMNRVCDDHAHMRSMAFRDNHDELAKNVLAIIERAKQDNLKQVDDLLAKPNLRRKTRRELEQCRQYVIKFNADLDEEWAELVEPPHAFDEHIHDAVRSEQ